MIHRKLAVYENYHGDSTKHHKEDKRDYKVSWDKAINIINFEPKYNIEDIILELWKHKLEFGDYQDDKYYNVKTFIKLNI